MRFPILFCVVLCTVLLPAGFFACAQLAPQAQPPPAATLTDNPSAPTGQNFFERLGDAYRADWSPAPASGPGPARRGYAGPLDSPAFPSFDYSVGGTPMIGAPDTQFLFAGDTTYHFYTERKLFL